MSVDLFVCSFFLSDHFSSRSMDVRFTFQRKPNQNPRGGAQGHKSGLCSPGDCSIVAQGLPQAPEIIVSSGAGGSSGAVAPRVAGDPFEASSDAQEMPRASR